MNRKRLTITRKSITHRATIGTMKLYFTVGIYPDGRPGELFIHNIEGPDVGLGLAGLADQWAIAISMLLQAGATVDELEAKFGYARYEPNGWTDNPQIKTARSLTDYIIRFMKIEFGEAAKKVM
jgi:ribonucleoside-diphosphate reductase alpha chain